MEGIGMIKCEVGYCLNNQGGICQKESINLNINRRCTDFLSEEDKKLIEAGLPPRGTSVVFHCED